MSIQWNDYTSSLWNQKSFKSKTNVIEFYDTMLRENVIKFNNHMPNNLFAQIWSETEWYGKGKPYYRIYPGIIDSFLRLDLSKVDTASLIFPVTTLLIQMPNQHIIEENGFRLINILVSVQNFDDLPIKGIQFHIEIQSTKDTCMVDMHLCVRPGYTFNDAFNEANPPDCQEFRNLIQAALKIVGVCLLLGQDPQIISPEVLTNDLRKWQETLNPKFVEKARKRGKYGWVVGREIEVLPHYRRPHLALFWTGLGRMIPVVKIRSGAIIHREIVEQIPTGFM